ncbi:MULTISPECIES: AarF/ABC1/UbiB kinase family protein [unclassified Rhizobium]|uniref:ABC1 kinase family protein n=1 Tax=unclassified Rhizobium TaxID=2613769 RepID=UPI000646887E|nr:MULTISPECIES: AarF/ABC1/UbiB kinase family protein [unclassified Rhizobium]OCI98797.1 ubiquinol-cytochrome C reductase [Rhizobium sp. AC27/96]TIX93359.1 AarF/ABC1/UbiB kinase family protein [Rhizobium sp. P44RR-XXIV]
MTDRFRAVPESRLTRLAALGKLAGGVAAGFVGEGLGRLARGERPHLSDLILTPGNARRVTEQLSRLRGAAMKLGQMISLDAGDILPSELSAILAELRDRAHFMPQHQLEKTLESAWGPGWRRRFNRFDMTPIAAASIGQVHRAQLASGRELAVKVQYPGVAKSIDADIDNVATLLRMSGLLPSALDIAPYLAEAKRQLHDEADYLREANMMVRYQDLLRGDGRFIVPKPADGLLHPTVLPMDFLEAAPIETLIAAPQTIRNEAMGALLDLVLRELLEFGLMQTDPNFANYRWQKETGRIALLDFGATRVIEAESAADYRRLLRATLTEDVTSIRDALMTMGFVSASQATQHPHEVNEIIEIVVAQLQKSGDGIFDFADRKFVGLIRDRATSLLSDRSSWQLPSPDKLFIQRKISGTSLLMVNMRAKLSLKQMLGRYC